MPLPPDSANLQYLYRADAGTFSDLAGTTPQAADGGSVALWRDQSGNGNDLGATAAPILKTNQINSTLPCLRFNGTSQFFYFSNAFISPNRTIYAVVKFQGADVHTIVSGDKNSTQWRIDTNKQRLVKSATADIGFGSGSIANNVWTQLNVSWDGTNGVFRKAGAADGTVSLAGVYGATRYVGSNDAHSSEWFADDLAVLLEYSVIHTTTQKQAVEAWITGIWGV